MAKKIPLKKPILKKRKRIRRVVKKSRVVDARPLEPQKMAFDAINEKSIRKVPDTELLSLHLRCHQLYEGIRGRLLGIKVKGFVAKAIQERRVSHFISTVEVESELPVYIIAEGSAHALAEISKPKPIDAKRVRPAMEGLIDAYGAEGYSGREKLFIYQIKTLETFDKPRAFSETRESQNAPVVDGVNLIGVNLKLTLSDIIRAHKVIVEEMNRRGMEHHFVGEIDTKTALLMRIKKMKSLPDEKTDARLISLHEKIHERFVERGDSERLQVLHAYVVEELTARGLPHVIGENDVLDLVNKGFRDGLARKFAKPEFATIHPSGDVLGNKIQLENILPFFNSFKLRKPYVYLVGGLVANGETEGDIDILIKDSELLPAEFRKVLEWRILRSLPPELQARVQFHYDNFHGPFTPFVELFDLTVERLPGNEVIEMAKIIPIDKQRAFDPRAKAQAETSRRENKIQWGRFFYPLKSAMSAIEAYREAEVYSSQAAIDYLKKLAARKVPGKEIPEVLVQKKYDGNRVIIFRRRAEVIILSDTGQNITARLPGIVRALKELKGSTEFAFDASLEKWEGKKHRPREEVAGYLHSKSPANDNDFVVNVFGALIFDGEDIHKDTAANRWRVLKKFNFPQSTIETPDVKKKLNLAPTVITDKPTVAKKAIDKVALSPGAEGAMVKLADSDYPLTGASSDIIKVKTYAEIHAIVWKVNETKVKGVYNYDVAVAFAKSDKVDEKLVVEIKGKKYLKCGRVYSTATKVPVGGVITVKFHTLNLYRDPETGMISIHLYEPIFHEVREAGERPDSIRTAIKVADDAELLREKPARQTIRESEKQKDPFLQIPDESEKHEYVVQQHFRGKSVHSDLRLDWVDDRFLLGWTLNTQIAGAIKEPVATLKEAKELSPENYSKINWENGEWAQRRTRAGHIQNVTLRSERKALEPKEWKNVQGVVAPGTAGGTANYPGVFLIVDKGTVEYGTQKTWVHEYFFDGKALDYRLVFRQLRLPFGSTEKFLELINDDLEINKVFMENLFEENLEEIIFFELEKRTHSLPVELREVLPPSEGAERPLQPGETGWFCIKPIDQTPYVLSDDAVKKKWIPPAEVSAVTKELRAKIPKEFQYWKKKKETERIATRDALVAAMKKEEVKLPIEVEKLSEVDARFVLQYQSFKGQTVIRGVPTQEFWDVRLDVGASKLLHLRLDDDPLDAEQMTAVVDRESDKKRMTLEGDIEPGTPLNPSKDTPSRIEILDKGKASVIDKRKGFVKIVFGGEELKGTWIARQNENDNLWLFEKTEPAPTEQTEKFAVEIAKVNKKLREVTGIVLKPEDRDAHGDIYSADVIRAAAHEFVANYNETTAIGFMHADFSRKLLLVESYIASFDFQLDGRDVPKGSWVITVKVLDEEIWRKVLEKKIRAFSIGGMATAIPG